MNIPLFIVGAGGFGREVFAIIEALEPTNDLPRTTGFIDDAPSVADAARVAALGARIVGVVEDLTKRVEPFMAVLAIGSGSARRTIAGRLAQSPVTYPVLVHPDATVGRHVRLAEGVVVAPGARLSTNIEVGRHVHIDQNAVIGHDSTLGDFSRLNPQACLSGNVRIGPGTLIGANAAVLQGLDLGQDVIVGAGAVVTHTVPPGTTVTGIPAR